MSNSFGGATTPNNWSYSFNLSEVKAIGEGTFKTAPEGYYTATIVETAQNNERGSIEFVVEINEGEFKGCRCEKGIKLPSERVKNHFVWKSLFQSIGYPEEVINQEGFSPNPTEWVNRPVFIFWRNGNKETNTYRELLFMSQDAWSYKKAKAEAATAAVTPQASMPAATPVMNAAPTLPQAPQASQVQNTIPQATPSNGSGFGAMNTASLLSSLNNR